MDIISVFNNKGGVGKSTLTYHLGNALAELGNKVLMIDLDPQCNLTISAIREEKLHDIWEKEDIYIEDFGKSFMNNPEVTNETRSIHFILKPTEDGLDELKTLPPPYKLEQNLDIIPGRLSLHRYENKIAERWNGAYTGDNLSIRTITNIRNIAKNYGEQYGYDYILIDTSPSLGILNKVIISTVDGFFIPAQPDIFSLYGIRNIGKSLKLWQDDFNILYKLISNDKRSKFPERFVQFLGYTIYNSKKYTKGTEPLNKYNLAQAHFQYVDKIPSTIIEFILPESREFIPDDIIIKPIGDDAIIHSHNTFPAMAQALKCPMWKVPEYYSKLQSHDPDYIELLKQNGFEYNPGNNGRLKDILDHYKTFTLALIDRINLLGIKKK